ncbi:MurR/RpiR family transcriptional regulator [Aquibacillus saliphilus]|uniref:MurR/RpiR family transcriptional regulator n=1 Tax=Aquibacillus saliphilus TaxID=1909422 RepID=UPI001CEFDB0C|nr:MurR/RpiR family transcriptional regulator [Aquibacillus saliphilus]
MNDIIYRLFDYINNHKDKDINYLIALTLLHDVKSIPNMNISLLANKCFTSPAAITRFCRRIGYNSFQEFKEYARLSVEQHNMETKSIQDSDLESVGKELQTSFYNKIVSWLNSSKDMIDIDNVLKMIDLIHDSSKVSFFGKQLSQAMAQDFQVRLIQFNKFVSAFSDILEQQNDIDELDASSLSVVVSPSGRFIQANKDLIQSIVDSKSKLIIITHNQDSPYLNKADIVIHLNGTTYDEIGLSSERFSLMYLFDFTIAYYSQIYQDNKI